MTTVFQVEELPALAREIGDIGNQIHNLGCEHQNDEELSARLGTIASALWSLSRQACSQHPNRRIRRYD